MGPREFEGRKLRQHIHHGVTVTSLAFTEQPRVRLPVMESFFIFFIDIVLEEHRVTCLQYMLALGNDRMNRIYEETMEKDAKIAKDCEK